MHLENITSHVNDALGKLELNKNIDFTFVEAKYLEGIN